MKRLATLLALSCAVVPACGPTPPPPTFRGTYTYMADAGRFTDCRTGTAFPVAAAGDNADLERAYAAARDAPGLPLLVTFTGHVEDRPGMEEGQVLAHVVVDSFIAVLPRMACDGEQALRGSFWQLASVNDQPARPSDQGVFPVIDFEMSGQILGYSGCNSFTGRYTISRDSLRIGPLAMTRRACLEEALNKQEHAFTTAVAAARWWRITGDTLILSGDAGVAARLTRGLPP